MRPNRTRFRTPAELRKPDPPVSPNGGARLDRTLAGFRRGGGSPARVPPRSRGLEGEPPVSQHELDEVVREYRHVHEDHRRAPPWSRVRRQLEGRLHALRNRFEELLAGAPLEERDRPRWAAALRGRARRAPAGADVRPLLFSGRSDTGSELRLSMAADGTVAAVVDGAAAVVFDDARELRSTRPGLVFTVGDVRFRETFGAPAAAVGDLRASLQEGRRPRRAYLRALVADGLVDRTLGLTARGRRALALDEAPARHAEVGVTPAVSVRGRVPKRARDHFAQVLGRVALAAPRTVIHIAGSLTRHADPALQRPVVAKASISLNGRAVHAHAEAASESQAIALVESRLRRELRTLRSHDLAARRAPHLATPGEWRHGDVSP